MTILSFIFAHSIFYLSPVNAAHVNCGDVITSDLTLDSDIGPCPRNGLVVNNSNIVLDLNEHSLTGPGFPFGFIGGIHLINSNNVTIKNGIISNFPNGILLEGRSNNFIFDNDIFGNSNGVTLLFASNNNSIF